MPSKDALNIHSASSAHAFSLLAPLYDSEQAHNCVARWSRARNLHILDRLFAPESHLLELGCGTGDEAIHLARRGVSVVATDAAPTMIGVLQDKLAREDAEIRARISTFTLPASKIGDLVSQFGKHNFDGAYSSFGPLNCEPDLAPVASALADMVKPGGRTVLSLLNRYCLLETAWYLLSRQPRKAFRRWSGRAMATVHGDWQHTRIPVYYWSPRAIEQAFSPHFRVVRRMALPWLLPPQYLDGLLRGRPGLFKLLARLDRKLADKWPFYTLGDHILFEMVRRPLL